MVITAVMFPAGDTEAAAGSYREAGPAAAVAVGLAEVVAAVLEDLAAAALAAAVPVAAGNPY